jgi:hypothetical protein
MENTALCIICGVDVIPWTGVHWYRPYMPEGEAVFAPPFMDSRTPCKRHAHVLF